MWHGSALADAYAEPPYGAVPGAARAVVESGLSTDAGGRPPAVALGRKRRARAGATNYATRTTVPGLLPLGARAVYAGNSNAPPARGAAHRPHPPAGWRGRWAVRVASPSRLPWGAYNWALRLRTEASSERQERRGSRRS